MRFTLSLFSLLFPFAFLTAANGHPPGSWAPHGYGPYGPHPHESGNGSQLVVDLGYARYQGIANSTLGTNTFWALPYAQPPTGNNRFRAPKPLEYTERWYQKGTYLTNATTPGPQCVQESVIPWSQGVLSTLVSEFNGPTIPSSEDCLTLDVIVPLTPRSNSLPVVVQIHGGGYVLGNSQSQDGHYFVQHSQGSVIYVQIQYRLGVYGFLGGAALMADGDANVGLLDQRMALEWTRRNIAAFGGDPDKITVWGGSAGGGSVTSQLIMHGGQQRQPFRAAIIEYPFWEPYHDTPVLEAQYRDLLSASGCQDLACVRGLSYDALANASATTYVTGYAKGQYGYGDYYFGPYIDGKILQDLPSREFQKGHWSKVPILTDRDAFEGILFTNFSVTTLNEANANLRTPYQTNSTSFLTTLDQAYPSSSFTGSYFSDPFFSIPAYAAISAIVGLQESNTAYFKLQAQYADAIIACPTYYIASAAVAANVPVWKLEYRAGLYVHAATAFALLEPSNATGIASPNNVTLSDAMKDYFLAFITDLDPNVRLEAVDSTARPYWPQYGSGAGVQILQVNQTDIGVRRDPDASARCDFWHGQSAVVRN